MRYVLGTESEDMAFSDEAIGYGPAGVVQAVDTKSVEFRKGRAFG
ncbi:MAG TPA: hypothetical protein VE441_12925 [Mycobacterium sp.]|jgi:hypothetical protein|nr:hypothetical protein [Mycobacterium sp.]